MMVIHDANIKMGDLIRKEESKFPFQNSSGLLKRRRRRRRSKRRGGRRKR